MYTDGRFDMVKSQMLDNLLEEIKSLDSCGLLDGHLLEETLFGKGALKVIGEKSKELFKLLRFQLLEVRGCNNSVNRLIHLRQTVQEELQE